MHLRPPGSDIFGVTVVHSQQFLIWGETVILAVAESASRQTLFKDR
ncbi:hypothetical protein [Sphingobium sp. HWE2-09]|nr:hypothetical protein [Sphingobium sp. HWE2-09]